MEVRLITLVESRIHGNMYVRFGGGFTETCYSNIVRRWVSILRLRAQYIGYLAICLISLLILFAILYILGVNTYLCLCLILGGGTGVISYIFRLSHKYGKYGLMKKRAKKQLPDYIKFKSRKLFYDRNRKNTAHL